MILKASKIPLFLLILGLVVFIGCDNSSDDIPTGSVVDVPFLIETGWTNFQNGEYSEAVDNFREATSRDALSAEAYLGLGWSQLRDGSYAAAISSIYNVESLIDLGMVQAGNIDRFKAESYACMAGTYQGLYPNDIPQYAPLVVQYVNMTLDIDPDFQFTYDNNVNRRTLIVSKADAYYVQGDFINALNTITELDSSLWKNAVIIENIQDRREQAVTLYDSTTSMGYARLTLSGANLVDIEKITADTLTNGSGELVEYDVAGYVQGGEDITFYGVPYPELGQYFRIDYYNAPVFDDYKAELRSLIDSYR